MIRHISLTLTAALLVAVVGISILTADTEPQAKPDVYFFGVAINVADVARSEAFYEKVFGLKRTFRYPPEGEGKLIEIGMQRPELPDGGTILLAHFNDDPLPEERTSYGRFIFNTDDAAAVAKRAADLGAATRKLEGGPAGSVIMTIIDPDGYELELYQHSSSSSGQ